MVCVLPCATSISSAICANSHRNEVDQMTAQASTSPPPADLRRSLYPTLAYIAAHTYEGPKLRSRISGIFEISTLVGAVGGAVLGGFLWKSFGQGAFLLNMGTYLLSALIFLSVHRVATKTAEAGEGHD